MFTAPYKLCDGGCNGSQNFGMAFPVYMGTQAKKRYKKMYSRDYMKMLLNSPNAPFRKKKTRTPTTPCVKVIMNIGYLAQSPQPEQNCTIPTDNTPRCPTFSHSCISQKKTLTTPLTTLMTGAANTDTTNYETYEYNNTDITNELFSSTVTTNETDYNPVIAMAHQSRRRSMHKYNMYSPYPYVYQNDNNYYQ